MKYILLTLAIVSPAVMATHMTGFGANYYQDDSTIANYDTSKGLVPDIIIGGNRYIMESDSLIDIKKITGATLNKDDQASWLCLTDKGITYWFISDNEMGQGDLTAIAIAKDEQPKGCSSYKGDLHVSIKDIPLLSASLGSITTAFSNQPNSNTFQYCADTPGKNGFTQMNCLHYFFVKNNVKGVLMSQITSN